MLCWWKCKVVQLLWQKVWLFLEKSNFYLSCDLAYRQKNEKLMTVLKLCMNIHRNPSHNYQKMETQLSINY